jgi:hypothetical protein
MGLFVQRAGPSNRELRPDAGSLFKLMGWWVASCHPLAEDWRANMPEIAARYDIFDRDQCRVSIPELYLCVKMEMEVRHELEIAHSHWPRARYRAQRL